LLSSRIFIPCILFFFFSSRRRHTRCLSDWSSDVCSSDLSLSPGLSVGKVGVTGSSAYGEVFNLKHLQDFNGHYNVGAAGTRGVRSEERRVGKEGRGGGGK